MLTSHQLAEILLAGQDLPIATYANNHTSAGDIMLVGLLEHYSGRYIIIGNMHRRDINSPNWFISEVIHGEIL